MCSSDLPNENIMAYCDDRNEREYLLRLPLPVKPKRLSIMPEAFIHRDKELSERALPLSVNISDR